MIRETTDMATYFDIITQEISTVDSNTAFYLIELPNRLYSMKAISEGLKDLPSDPYTQATYYWPITVSNFDDVNLFPNGVLREESLLINPLILCHQKNHSKSASAGVNIQSFA